VWLDDLEIRPGDSIPAKIEEGLEHSRVLVLCMSANAFGSDWAQLESGTFRFRDPLNKERRFVPLRLDDTPIKGSLGQFLYINWLPPNREQEYAKLLQACRNPTDWPPAPNPKEANPTSLRRMKADVTGVQSRDCLAIRDKYEELRGRFYEREEFVKAMAGQRVHGSGLVAEVKSMGQHIEVRVRVGGERRIGIFLCCPVEWRTKLFALRRGDTVRFAGVSQKISGLGIALTPESVDYETTAQSLNPSKT
jgi:hypothetical protein